MSQSTKDIEMDYATKAIHAGQDHNQWSNLEIIPPVVTSITYYEPNATKPKVPNRKKKLSKTRIHIIYCIFRALIMVVMEIQRVHLWRNVYQHWTMLNIV